MLKIFTTDKVKTLDQYTIQHEPISSIDLVERAATQFMHEFCRRYSKQTRISPDKATTALTRWPSPDC